MPIVTEKKKSAKKLLTMFRKFFAPFLKKKKRTLQEEMDDIDEEKKQKNSEIQKLILDIEKLSGQLVDAHVKEVEANNFETQFAAQEGVAGDASIRRALERSRWEYGEKRRAHEGERWSIVESLRHANADVCTLRKAVLSLELRAGDIEQIIEKKPSKETPAVVNTNPQESVATATSSVGILSAKRGMLVRDLLSLSLRTFRVKLGMTMLTVLGIGVSFATVFFLVSLGYGLEKVLLDQFASETSMRSITVQSPNPEVVPLNSEISISISQLPGVEHVEPIFGLPGQIESDALASEVQLHGTDPKYFSITGGKIKEGRVYKSGEHAVVLSSNFLQTMNKKSLSDFVNPISITAHRAGTKGDEEGIEAVLLGNDFRVVGISENDESSDVYLPPEYLSSMVSQFSALDVLVKTEDEVAGLRTVIADKGFMSSSIVDTVDQARKVFNIAEIILALFGSASIVVATIGMINTMTVSLLERTQEIGIMKVLGVSDGDVRRLFLLEATIIGGLGGISGLIVGLSVSEACNLLINFLAKSFGGKAISLFYYPTWFVGTIIISSFVIGFLTGLVPSQRAAKMDPLNAVKYK